MTNQFRSSQRGDPEAAQQLGGRLLVRSLDHYIGEFAKHLEKRKLLWLGCLTILYMAFTIVDAWRKPMWYDEFFTFYISRFPRIGDIWSLLAAGVDSQPPLSYLLTRASHQLLGYGHVATRLPAILGYWAMSLGVFRFVSKRCSAPYAFLAILFPLVSITHRYAYEARPYGVLLGTTGAALVCWQSSVERGRFRRMWLIGLAATLAVAVANHYYAVLIFVSIAAGELTRSWLSRRIDWPVWIALGLGAIPVLWFLPLVQGSSFGLYAYTFRSSVFWAKPSYRAAMEFYPNLFTPTLIPILACLAIGTLAQALQLGKVRSEASGNPRALPLHETIAVIVLSLAPFMVMILAKLFTGYYMDRYGISAVVGCSILVGFFSYFAAAGRAIVGTTLVLVFFAWFMIVSVGRLPITPGVDSISSLNGIIPENDSSPIAISNPLLFLQLSYYGSQALASRVFYLSDPSTAVQYPDFLPDWGLAKIKDWVPLKIEDYSRFVSSHPRFWVYYSSVSRLEWLPSKLLSDHNKLEFKAQKGDNLLFDVTTVNH